MDIGSCKVWAKFIIFLKQKLFIAGSSIVVNTYDGRLHIGLSIDKALVENYSDVQEIADNILKYLDILEEEILKCGTDVEIVL